MLLGSESAKGLVWEGKELMQARHLVHTRHLHTSSMQSSIVLQGGHCDSHFTNEKIGEQIVKLLALISLLSSPSFFSCLHSCSVFALGTLRYDYLPFLRD